MDNALQYTIKRITELEALVRANLSEMCVQRQDQAA